MQQPEQFLAAAPGGMQYMSAEEAALQEQMLALEMRALKLKMAQVAARAGRPPSVSS